MKNFFHTFIYEPAVSDAPKRVWRDWVLVVAFTVTIVLEGFLRNDIAWPFVSLPFIFGLMFTVMWRRTKPLLMLAVAFCSIIVFDVFTLISGAEPLNVYTAAFLLVLVYALFRWGSGPQCLKGSGIMLAIYVSSQITDYTTVVDAVAGLLILYLPAELGMLVRYHKASRAQKVERTKLHEREQLARELHDTVAHHVSAIAIQAQAGQVLVKSNSSSEAIKALSFIEEEASRTLVEMRSIVGALRESGSVDMAVQPGIADIKNLASRGLVNSPTLEVETSGELGDLRPSVDAAIYRLAQESITNAVKHSRKAKRINVKVSVDSEFVHLEVTNDGEVLSKRFDDSGYGLVGMNERAALLGGSFDAGPLTEGGWKVEASIPKFGKRKCR